jgi:hypothetical protein
MQNDGSAPLAPASFCILHFGYTTMKITHILLLAALFFPLMLLSQGSGSIGSFTGDESRLYAQTKQVNQFFRRFNGEEDISGKRLYENDVNFRSQKLRKKYMEMLFDQASPLISKDAREVFVLDVTGRKIPVFLDFHSPGWFAEASAEFQYGKEQCNVILYFKLEKDHLGYKWAISNVYFPKFEKYFRHVGDTSNATYFIHPMSHELDFMNLNKLFSDTDKLDYYSEKEFIPDHLSLFLKETKDGNLRFLSVNQVKFHFFQIPQWYFEVSFFNRNSMNSGWLISNLLRINDEDKKKLIRNYTHEK